MFHRNNTYANPSNRLLETFSKEVDLFDQALGFWRADAGLPLGIMECQFSEREVELTSGSRVFFYSDGITEAVNSSFEEYGLNRIAEHVTRHSATVKSLLGDVDEFTSGFPKSDDVTVVMVAAAP